MALIDQSEQDFSDIELFLEDFERDIEEDYGISVDDATKGGSQDPAAATSNQPATSQKKVAKKKKVSYKYPSGTFSKEQALEKSTEVLEDILKGVISDPLFQMETPAANAVLKLVRSILVKVDSQAFIQFSGEMISLVWPSLQELEGKTWTTGCKDNMWMSFQLMRSSSRAKDAWDVFLSTDNIQCGAPEKTLLLQHVLVASLEVCISRLLKLDTPTAPVEVETITKHEEQALRYCAGYIPYKLLKHFERMKKTKTSQDIIRILRSWSSEMEDAACDSYLDYSKAWLELQSRGGLFKVSDDVFNFFKSLEDATRKNLNIKDIKNINLVTVLDKLATDDTLITSWNKIVPSSAVSKHLFERVLKAWMKMRSNGFLRAYENILAKQDDTTRQKQKGLRKELQKTSTSLASK